MKFTCTQENLSQGLNLVSHIAAKNTTLPILNNVLIKAEKGNITLTTTNLEIGVTCVIRGKVDVEGAFTVQSRLINDFVNLVSSEKIDISLKDQDNLEIKSEKSETTIKGMPADDFPLIPEIKKQNPFIAKASDLSQALSQTLFATSNSETRPEISGVFMKFENGSLILAATDSYRLAEKSIKCSGKEMQEVIVPARALAELQRVINNLDTGAVTEGVDGTVEIYFQDNQVMFSYKNVELVSRLIEGTYPAYQQIIPTSYKTKAVINVAEFVKAVKTASLFSRLGVFDVNLEFKSGKLKVFATNNQLGENKTELDVVMEGEANNIILNHKFLTDGLNNLKTTEVIFEMNDEASPCVLKPAESLEGENVVEGMDYKYIIMPIKQ